MDEFDEFLMIMMLEMLVKLSNLIPPAIESYIIRQIRPFTDQIAVRKKLVIWKRIYLTQISLDGIQLHSGSQMGFCINTEARTFCPKNTAKKQV